MSLPLPKATYSLPKATYSLPKATYSLPKATYSLPVELWTAVFRHLSYPDIVSCKNVSQLWKQIIEANVPAPKTLLSLIADQNKYNRSFNLLIYLEDWRNYHTIDMANIHMMELLPGVRRIMDDSTAFNIKYDGHQGRYATSRIYRYYDLYLLYNYRCEGDNRDILSIANQYDHFYVERKSDNFSLKMYERWFGDCFRILREPVSHDVLLRGTNNLKAIFQYFRRVDDLSTDKSVDELVEFVKRRFVASDSSKNK